jgi:hypothetical protein
MSIYWGGDSVMAGRSIIVQDRAKSIISAIHALAAEQVLVGIPEANTARTQGTEITNAELGYIHENGAPAANIPARAWLVPGVRKSQAQYLPHLRGAYDAALDGEPAKAHQELTRAGIVAENSAKREITTGNFVPLSPATIAARRYSRDTQTQRESEERYLALVRGGATPAAAQVATGIHPLINTAQMRNAVTSVVRQAT